MPSSKRTNREIWADFYNNSSDHLTDDERRIVRMLSGGKTQREIAAELGLQRSSVYHKIRKLKAML